MKQRDVIASALFVATVAFVVAYFLTDADGTSAVDTPEDESSVSLDAVYGSTIGAVMSLMSSQTVSSAGLDLIKQYESCKLTAYFDVNGYSIGWGHHDASEGQTCTQAQADAWLLNDANAAAAAVLRYCRVPLEQNQLDALTSWVYNLGASKVANATLWKLLNGGDYGSVPAQLARWCDVNGSPNADLQARREAEGRMWSGE